MSLYAISDLHLPIGINKPMDIFGRSWENYVDRLKENWNETIKDEDTVLINGDISWATYLEQSKADFCFLSALPGKKLISKGNHDYWWTTKTKLDNFFNENMFNDITVMYNNAVLYKDYAICAARGWKSPFDKDFGKDDQLIYERELIRLKLSLDEGKKISDKIIVMLHYPPDVGFSELLDKYEVSKCVYGHLHGEKAWEKEIKDDRYLLVSADFLQFIPTKILE